MMTDDTFYFHDNKSIKVIAHNTQKPHV